jgi:hypothetical protein
VEWVWIFFWNHVRGPEASPLGGKFKNQPPAKGVGQYFFIWVHFTSCSFRSGMGMGVFVEACILFPVRSEVEWVWIFLWNRVHGHEVNTLGHEHKN